MWKQIPGYEGLYEVSSTGMVRSLKRAGTRGGELKTKKRNGYLAVDLVKNNLKKTFDVHRIVAETFVSNPDKLPQVNHIDENKTNNDVSNLEWCTAAHNINHGSAIGRMVETREQKAERFYCVETGKVYRSKKKCAEDCGISRSYVSNLLYGRRKSDKYHILFID